MKRKQHSDYAPVTFWSLNSRLEKEEAALQLRAFAAAGFGGVFLHSRVGLITLYMSEEWLDFISFCVDTGDRLGLNMYLYDEDMWPSGYGEGKVSKLDPSFREKTLLLISPGQEEEEDEYAGEYKGKKIVVRTTKNGYIRFNGGCFIDEMNPHAVKAFLSLVHEEYYKKMSDRFGSKIKGIFTDEPCYNLSSFHAEPHVPFSPCLAPRLKEEFGFDWKENAWKLFSTDPSAAEFRIAYYKAAGRQFLSAYTVQYAKWCADHGIIMTGHLMEEDSLKGQIRFTGGVMPHYFAMQQPGIDKLFRTIDQTVTVKQLTSACEWQEKRALCECFAGMGQEATFFDRKKILDWQAVHGIDFVNPHLSLYSMQGERKRDYPANINYQQPYFCCMNAENGYIEALSQVIATTKRVVSVAVIQPLSSAFAEYDPLYPDAPLTADEKFSDVVCTLASRRVDFHVLSEEMLGACVPGEKTLKGGGFVYDTVILPDVKYPDKKAAGVLAAFSGTTVSYGGCYRETTVSLATKEDLERFVSGRLSPCVEISGADETILARKGTGADGEYIFVCNTSDESKTVRIACGECSVKCLSDRREYACGNDPAVTLLPHGSVCLKKGKGISGDLPYKTCFRDGFILDGEAEIEKYIPELCGYCNFNLLPVDKVNFTANGVSTGKVPVNHIWHYIFYKLEDGTPFRAEYSFICRAEVSGEVFLLVENAENLDKITINGTEVRSDRAYNAPQISGKGCAIDISLARVNVTGKLRSGENTIVIEGRKYNNVNDVCCHHHVEDFKNYASTEVDTVYVCGDFGVEFASGNCDPYITKSEINGLYAHENGRPFYAGGTEYRIKALLNKGDEIVLSGDFAAAKIRFRDGSEKVCGNVLPSAEADAASDGFSVFIYNTLFNMVGPHHIVGYDEKIWIDPGIFNDTKNVEEGYKLFPFGLKEVCVKRR